MKIYRNVLGWEDEEGYQLAFDEEHSFMNIGRADNHKRPIWKEEQTSEEKQDD